MVQAAAATDLVNAVGFVAVGRGHDVAFWGEFLRALHKIDADMAVNSEHEDQELDQLEGLKDAASSAKVVRFDMNPELIAALKAGDVQFAMDQQP